MRNVFNQPGRFWRGNLHTHSTRSDGLQTPEAVCRFYRDAGYDFICLSDHFIARFQFPVTDTRPYQTDSFTTLIGAELHTAKHTMELCNVWHLLAVGLPLAFAPTDPGETGPQLARRALDAGAFVAAAHPAWFGMTDADFLSLGPIHAVEIYNANAGLLNDCADSSSMLDTLLMRGLRPFACACDDAHDMDHVRERLMGRVMVKSESLEPDALLTALKAGDYYSSTGPELLDVQVIAGEHVTVRCSPAEHIFAVGRPTEYRSVSVHGITEADISLAGWDSPYLRLIVRDAAGQRAWSNPIWLDREG